MFFFFEKTEGEIRENRFFLSRARDRVWLRTDIVLLSNAYGFEIVQEGGEDEKSGKQMCFSLSSQKTG